MKQIAAFTTHSNKTYNFAFHSLSLIYKQDKEAMSVLRRYRLEQLNCARGEKCNVNYAAVVWVLWNKYVQR